MNANTIQFTCLSLYALLLIGTPAVAQSPAPKIKLMKMDGKLEVRVENKLFTRYDYSSFDKPIFFPILGPSQISMTRSFPMKTIPGEANDHPHHKSMWIGHEINRVDFWSERGGVVRLRSIQVDENSNSFTAVHDWNERKTNKTIAKDRINATFGAGENYRWIDFQICFSPNGGPLTFADTKEGLFALRVHPRLRLSADPKRGVSKANGIMSNSEGQSGKKIWGRKARWVSYTGKSDDDLQTGIVMMDHPSNLRHPTTWHARDYGLLAANPFGLHHFQKSNKGAGEWEVPVGQNLNLRYRVVFYTGQWQANDIDEQFQKFAKQK
ncbi:MAG: PmoA family protein [Planctomycetota bacterium]